MILAGLTVATLPADEVITTSGVTIQGIIGDETAEGIDIMMAGLNRMHIPADRVAEIRRQEPAANHLLMGDMHLQQGLLWEAAGHYTQALSLGVHPTEIAPSLMASPGALVIMLDAEPPERAAEERNLFLRILSAMPRNDRVLHLAGRLCEVTGDRARAMDAYQQINPEWWDENPTAAQDTARFFLHEAQNALARDDFPRAQTALAEVTAIDDTLADSLRPMFILHMANQRVSEGRCEEGIELVMNEVAPLAPAMANTWLESVLSEIEHQPFEVYPPAEALAVFDRYAPLVYPDDAEERLAALHLRAGHWHLARGEYAAARLHFNRHCDIVDPMAPVRPLVQEATYREALSEIAPDDWEDRLSLTLDIIDDELWPLALAQLEILQEAPDEQIVAFAEEQRLAIIGRQAQSTLGECFILVEQGEFQDALDLLNDNGAMIAAAEMDDMAIQLRRICQDRMSSRDVQQAHLARNLLWQAETQFYRGHYEQCIALLERLIVEHPRSEFAEDAITMLNLARQRLAVRRASVANVDLDSLETTPQLSSTEIQRQEFQEILEAAEASVMGVEPPPSTP